MVDSTAFKSVYIKLNVKINNLYKNKTQWSLNKNKLKNMLRVQQYPISDCFQSISMIFLTWKLFFQILQAISNRLAVKKFKKYQRLTV